MKKTTISALLLFFCTLMYGQETKTFKKDKITFEYPDTWIIRDFPMYYILVSEPPKEVISVMTTFDVAIDTVSKTLGAYCKNFETTTKTSGTFKDFKIITKKKLKYKRMKAVEYHCTATAMNLPIEWRSTMFNKDGKIYKLSTTSMTGQFVLIKETTDKIFDSFEIK